MIYIKLLLSFFCILQCCATEIPTDNIPTSNSQLSTLNLKIKALKKFLIEQDRVTPLEETCLRKPADQNPLDYYKEILLAYAPFRHKDPGLFCVKAYASLARTHLDLVKKRSLYRKCRNLDQVLPDPDNVHRIMERLRFPSKNVCSNDLIPDLIQKTTVEPIIERLNEEDDKDRIEIQRQDNLFLLYFKKFEEEIEKAVLLKKTNYRWFMIFSDQLSLLTTKLLYRSFNMINTNYPAYLEQIDNEVKFPNFHENRYLTQLQRQNIAMSLPGLLNQFPDIFLMPYPFVLESLDFLNFGVGSKQLFWPCGMVFKPAAADGWYHCPRLFFGHDWHHLGLLLSSMITPTVFVVHKKEIVKPKPLANVLLSMRNSFMIYNLLLREFNKEISAIKNSEKKKIFAFFAFYGFHEGLCTIKNRLQSVFGIKQESFEETSYYEDTYYRGLFPSSKAKLDNSNLKTYLRAQHVKYGSFCRRHISPKVQTVKAQFLKYFPDNSGNLFYLYSIHKDNNLVIGHSNDKNRVGCEIYYYFTFTFSKICSSPGDIPSFLNVNTNCLSVDKDWSKNWKKAWALYEELKEKNVIIIQHD